MSKLNFCLKCALVGIILNVVLSKLLSHFATDAEINPPIGADALSYKEQFMHMMVHHEQVLCMSSFIIGLVVFLSVCLAKYTKI